MNRLSTLEAIAANSSVQWSAPQPSYASSATCSPCEQSSDADCTFFRPLHYEPGYSYPLLVWLHADGGDEKQLSRIMPHVSVRNFIGVAVRGAAAPSTKRGSYRWSDCAEGLEFAAQQVQSSIQQASERYQVNLQRVFVVGHLAGGTMALRLALTYPEWFTGAVSLEGRAPRGGTPLCNLNRARRLPLLIASCLESSHYSCSHVADDLRLLHAAGFSLALRQYQGPEGLTTVMLSDVNRWAMDLVCGSACLAEC